MLVLLAGIFVIHIATVVMLFVSTIANAWMVSSKNSTGLWQWCDQSTCSDVRYPEDELPALKAVQAFMILAIIFSFISLIMFMVQLFTMEKGKRFYITGVIMLVAWACILIGASIYTDRFPPHLQSNYHHGYSFILAWICFCFSFIIGVLYLVLRKK